ncbi:MAG: NAD(P)-dependent oxidoreductase [Pseudomonadota bacterium]
MSTPKITLLGTGLMGAPMARNIAAAGFALTVWNRTEAKAQALADAGITVAPDVAAAVAGADTIISMLSDGPSSLAMLADALPHVAPGALWIDMASTKPAEARAMADTAATQDVAFLDAPVSGGTKGAEGATLAIMVGGAVADVARAQPLLASMGRPVHVGATGAGQLAKLCNQAIVAITIGAVAEATLLATQGGADPAALRAALKGGFADSTILQQHGTRMSDGDFVPGGRASVQVKDLDNILAEAAALNLSLPMATEVRDRFAHLIGPMGQGDADHSALYLELLARNGLG